MRRCNFSDALWLLLLLDLSHALLLDELLLDDVINSVYYIDRKFLVKLDGV